jgi:hypothetical protein
MASLKFTYTATKASFETVKANHFYDINFIADEGQIYTHGKYYCLSATDTAQLNTLISAAQGAADAKISEVSGSGAIEVSSSDTTRTVSLLIDGTNAGNVVLSQTAAGLTASVDLSGVENLVEGVATGENVLSLTSKKLATTLSLDYNSTTKKIQLKGIGDVVISDLDATAFITDGMLDSVSLVETAEQGVSVTVPYLKLTFNTDSGKSVERISLSSLIDVYNGENLELTSNYAVAQVYTAPTSGDSVNVAIGKLAKGIADALVAAGVTSFGGKSGAITVASGGTTNGDVNFSVSEQGQLSASVYGLGTAAYTASTDYATSTQGGYADSALQSVSAGTDGSYFTTTVGTKTGNDGAKTQTIAGTVTVQAISSADSTHMGLVEASDAKSYVDGLLTWVELTPSQSD